MGFFLSNIVMLINYAIINKKQIGKYNSLSLIKPNLINNPFCAKNDQERKILLIFPQAYSNYVIFFNIMQCLLKKQCLHI